MVVRAGFIFWGIFSVADDADFADVEEGNKIHKNIYLEYASIRAIRVIRD
jgi:hypothetical protein